MTAARAQRPRLHAALAAEASASAAPIAPRLRNPGEPRALFDLLGQILAELRGLRADLRRRNDESPAIVAAIEDYFAGGRFTVDGLLMIADDEPHSAMASALANVIDLDASPRSRSTSLGTLLARLPQIETVARSRGVAVYRLRTWAG